jgi:hypothetical protein
MANIGELIRDAEAMAEFMAEAARKADMIGKFSKGAGQFRAEEPAAPVPPLETRIKEWSGRRRHQTMKILLFLARQPDRSASVTTIGKEVYRRRMTGHSTENNRRTVVRQLGIIARNRAPSFFVSFDGTKACIVDCTR